MPRMPIATALVAFIAFSVVTSAAVARAGQQPHGKAALMDPAALTEQAPATFNVVFDTSAGQFVVGVHRDWAPLGVDRFYNLVKRGFYDGNRFFRVLPDYMVQFGINGDPELSKIWFLAQLSKDDPVKQSNKKGTMAFIPGGAGRRTTQLFINLNDNSSLDAGGAAAFGQVISGMNVVEKLYAGYGDEEPHGNGPDRNRFYAEGNAYLEKELPKLDYIKTATIKP